MLFPHPLCHLLNGDILSLGDQEKDEGGHDEDPSREEKEDSKLEVAQHGEESLCNEKREEEVNTDRDTLPR